MEDEKKKGADRKDGASQKNRHGRRKSYFIEPAKPGTTTNVTILNSTTSEKKASAPAEKSAGAEQKSGDHGRNRGHHKRRSDKNRNPEQSKTAASVDGQEAKGQNGQPQKVGNRPAQSGNQTPSQGQSGGKNRPQKKKNTQQKQGSQKQASQQAPKEQPQSQAEQTSGSEQRGDSHKSRNRSRNRNHGRDRGPKQNRDDLLLTDSLLSTPSFFDKRKNAETEESDEEIIPYIPADDDDLSGRPAPKEIEGPQVEVVGIRFKASGKMYYFAPGAIRLERGSFAIVETARGQEYGEVAMGNTMVSEKDTVPPLRPVLRAATEADIRHHEENKKKEDDACRICNEKIAAHGLDMKLIDAQYTFDNTKLLFYFTSSGRVDFRELVKDLASVFRTRIELRQIGIRDEAKMMGGLGPCGRPLCCTLFLSDFGQVSIKMAKEQNLSLNSSKISGICGRLMCCLRYEYETYEYEIKRTPPVDSLVKTEDGVGVVTEMNPLKGTVKVRLTATPDVAPKIYKRDDVVVLQRKQDKADKGDKQDKPE